MMSSNKKKAFLKDLDNYIDQMNSSFVGFMETLGWTESFLTNEVTPSVVCPLDSNHIMPETSLEKHLESCSWIKEGYTHEEKEKALPSSHFFYKNSTSVVPVLLDKDTQTQILQSVSDSVGSKSIEKPVPKTMDRAVTDLTPSERLAIYEYVVAKGKATNKSNAIKLEDLQINYEKREGPKKHKSHLEILAEQRDYKRRRQSYRAKNVHITKKSYTEVMRELILNQMEVIEHEVKQEQAEAAEIVEQLTISRSERHSKSRDDSKDSKDHKRSKHKHSSSHRKRRDRSPHSDDERRKSHHHKHKSHKSYHKQANNDYH